MVSPQAVWQIIIKFIVDNQDLVRNLVIISGASLSSLIGLILWCRNQKRKRQFPPAIPSPFEIIRPNNDVLSVVFPGNKRDPLANAAIRYQNRCPTRQVSVRQELIQKLSDSDWLLIEGRTGLGKTREAGELAQLYNREGWTVMWLRFGAWVDEPTSEHLRELNTNRKLLFLLDDLNQRMSFGVKEKSPRAETSPFEPINESLQNRLLRSLTAYESFCGNGEIKVLATARNERFSDIPGQPSPWDKLEKDRYSKFWHRFTVYELPEPEDTAIAQLLRDTIPETEIYAQEENYLPIARKNDQTFRNVVENLVRLRNRKLPLTPINYRDTLKENWSKRYQDAVMRYPISVHIYDAINLLQKFEVPLTRRVVEPTVLLVMDSQIWQLWHRYFIKRALDYLIDAELILTPRDGQIEASEAEVENKKYVQDLSKLVLELTHKQVELMFNSLYNFALNLNKYSYYQEALVCLTQLITYLPNSPKIGFVWNTQSNVLNNLQRYEEAITSCDKALELNSNFAEAWCNRGYALAHLGFYKESIESYNKTLKLQPNFAEAWMNLGIISYDLKRYEKAIKFFDEVVALNSNCVALAWNNRGSALNKLKLYREALKSYDEALKINPNSDMAWFNKACIYSIENNICLAMINLAQAINLNPECREYAKTDSDFDNIREETKFIALIESE